MLRLRELPSSSSQDYYNKELPQSVKTATPVYRTKLWAHSALPMLFASSTGIIIQRTDVIMLGAMKGTEEVGFYTVANRLAAFIRVERRFKTPVVVWWYRRQSVG